MSSSESAAPELVTKRRSFALAAPMRFGSSAASGCSQLCFRACGCGRPEDGWGQGPWRPHASGHQGADKCAGGSGPRARRPAVPSAVGKKARSNPKGFDESGHKPLLSKPVSVLRQQHGCLPPSVGMPLSTAAPRLTLEPQAAWPPSHLKQKHKLPSQQPMDVSACAPVQPGLPITKSLDNQMSGDGFSQVVMGEKVLPALMA